MPSTTRDTRWHWFPVYLHAPSIVAPISDSGPCFYRFSPAFIFRTLWRPKRGAPPATRTPDSEFRINVPRALQEPESDPTSLTTSRRRGDFRARIEPRAVQVGLARENRRQRRKR